MKSFYNLVFIIINVFLWISICTNTSLAQNSGIIKIVAQGEPAPAGGTFRTLSSADFNDNEDILFVSEIAPFKYGSFIASVDRITSVIIDSQFVDGLGMITRSSAASINNNGSIAFSAQIVNGDSKRDGLFLKTAEGTITPIVYNDDPIDGGTIGTPSLRPYSLNNNGAIAFSGYINPEPFRQAIFINSGGTVSKVVATGEETPLGGTYKFAFMNMFDFNDAGTVLFGSDIEGGSSPEGIFTASGGVITKIVARGDPSLDGKQFTYLDPASINNLGDIIFEASVGIDFGTDYDGLFLYSGGVITQIVRTGDAAPGGGTFGTFSLAEINDSKQIVFEASVDGGASGYRIFLYSEGVIGEVVANGKAAPIGGSFSNVAYPLLNGGGSIVFTGHVEGGSAPSGIFLWNGGPKLDVSRDTVEFTDIVPGQTARLDMEITNSGGKPLEVQEITASPSPPFGVENVPSLPLSIEPGQKAQFLVIYSSPSNNSITLEKITDALQDGSLTIKTNAPNQSTVIPIIAPKSTTLKVDIVPSEGTEVKAGQFATIEIKVVDQSNNVLSDFNGGATIKLIENQSTPGITRLPAFQSVSISNGVAQSTFFYTPKEPFALDKPINKSTVLTGKAVIEVQLENSSIPPVKKEIQVKSPLDFYIDSIEVQQGVRDLDKAVTLEYKPGENRTFPALPFIAEHKTAMRVFIKYNNPVPIPFSKIEELVGFSGELVIKGSNNQGPIKFTGPYSNQFVFKDSYEQNEKTAMFDGLFFLINPEMLKNPGSVTLETELKLESNLDEAANEKINNKKTRTITLAATNQLKILAAAGAYGAGPYPNVTNTKWDFIKDVYPIQTSNLKYNDPNTMALSLNKGIHSGGPFFFMDVTKTLDRFNKENPTDQRDIMVIFVDASLLNDICGKASGCTPSFFSRISFISALGSSSTVAHEVGHTLGLKDTYPGTFINGEPNPRRSDATSQGNRVELGHIHFTSPLEITSRSPIYIDFMGALSSAWIDRVTWDYLYNSKFKLGSQNITTANAKNSLESYIAISGIISKSDTVTLNSFLTLFQVPGISETQTGDYSIEFLNSNGNSLYTFTFPIEFVMPDEGEVSEIPFSFYLPLPEGTSKFEMKKNGVKIASRNFSINPPVVQLASPQSGEVISGIKTIQWTASDVDGDKLTYDLLYSPDGINQQVLAVNLADTLFEWNSLAHLYSSSASITVIANDGINESRSVADNLLIDSPSGTDAKEEILPQEFTLRQNYPNPFNPTTTINFDLPKAAEVSIIVYDIQGQEVKTVIDKRYSAGQYFLEWNGKDNLGREVSSGVYFIQMRAGDFMIVIKAILLR